MKVCKFCGGPLQHQGRTFCSQRCANKQRVKDGTCNLLKKNGGSELARKHNQEMVDQGIHPFLKENFTDESQKKAAESIRLARIDEAQEGRHPWQTRSSRINNERARELSIYTKKGVDWLQIYIADSKEFPKHIKVGITSIGEARSKDFRWILDNIDIISEGPMIDVVNFESELKYKFSTKESFSETGSYELFPLNLEDEIRQFILSRFPN